jgi:hypothetical protein
MQYSLFASAKTTRLVPQKPPEPVADAPPQALLPPRWKAPADRVGERGRTPARPRKALKSARPSRPSDARHQPSRATFPSEPGDDCSHRVRRFLLRPSRLKWARAPRYFPDARNRKRLMSSRCDSQQNCSDAPQEMRVVTDLKPPKQRIPVRCYHAIARHVDGEW